jgi:Predicted kinase
MNPTLFIFSGLPGSGKSTIAKKIASTLRATHLRIDTIEQGLRDLCNIQVQGEGYRLSYRIAKDNLSIGNNVISDSCNPWKLTRNEWENVAKECNSNYVNIEIICSNISEHKERIINRKNEIEGLILPDWEEIVNRNYEKWDREHIVIDTASKSIEESINELEDELAKMKI